MDSRKIRNLRNNFDRNMLDKQVDKLFETGRQFVDGVSGTRPGKRRNSDFQGITSKNVKKVGRWVSEKVDLFFDEDIEDWHDEDDFYNDKREMKNFTQESRAIQSSHQYSKRPLEALSLRQPKNVQINEQKRLPYVQDNTDTDWPEESDFKVNRWQRSEAKDSDIFRDLDTQGVGLSNSRNLPRSRRRRV